MAQAQEGKVCNGVVCTNPPGRIVGEQPTDTYMARAAITNHGRAISVKVALVQLKVNGTQRGIFREK
jgi:hypothetical protein